MAACPTSGETNDLSGTATAEDIEITCVACLTTWLPGDPRCKGCGASGGIPCRQVMTRTPRGNRVAVVGHREVTLCLTCDAAALAATESPQLPEDYVWVFPHGVKASARAAPPGPTPKAAIRQTALPSARPP